MINLVKLYGKLSIALIVVVFVSAACTAAYNDAVLGNKDHGLSCEQLPLPESVDQVLAEHNDVVEQILSANTGNVFLDVDREICPGKADIVISFATSDDRQKIESILGDDTFFGVPVRLRNR